MSFLYRSIFRIRPAVLLFAVITMMALFACDTAKERRVKQGHAHVWKQFVGDPTKEMLQYRIGGKPAPPLVIQKEKKK